MSVKDLLQQEQDDLEAAIRNAPRIAELKEKKKRAIEKAKSSRRSSWSKRKNEKSEKILEVKKLLDV